MTQISQAGPSGHGVTARAMGSPIEASRFRLSLFACLAAAIAISFCAPLVIFVCGRGDFTFLASEALSYRFFYSLRLHAGPDTTAWLPQGQLLNTVQNAISYFLIDRDPARLRSTLNIFAIATVAIVDMMAVGFLVAAAWLPRLRLGDIFLVGLTLLAPVYLARDMAVAALWPDYYLLDFVMAAAALLLFQRLWRGVDAGPSITKVLLTGIFVGLLASNKVSMAILGVPAVAVAISMPPISFRTFVLRGALAAAASLTVFGLVFAASGLFQIGWVIAVAKPWLHLVTNPGGDGSRLIDALIPSYAAMMSLGMLAGAAAIVWAPRTARRMWILFITAAMGIAAFYFIAARPAGTTIGDTAIQMLALGAMLVTTIDRSAIRRSMTVAMALVCFVVAIFYPLPNFIYWLNNSGPIADEQWKFFQQVAELGKGRSIVYYIPGNQYQRGDPFIILLKGSSNFPTWDMSAGGQALIDRYMDNLSFVSDLSGGDRAVSDGSVLVWYDFPEFISAPDRYPQLRAALRCCSMRTIDAPMPEASVIGHAALIK
jgi:hypothetical protein